MPQAMPTSPSVIGNVVNINGYKGWQIKVKISHYDPALGGTNCGHWDTKTNTCTSRMANGERWQDYYTAGNAIACPKELAFGTRILLEGRIYTCKDRGGAIRYLGNNTYWIDILAIRTGFPFGIIKDAMILK